MLFSTITLLFATAVLGMPTETVFGSGLRVRGSLDQGDGFYLAVVNKETGIAEVQFTPLAKLKARNPVPEVTDVEAHNLLKRKTTCSGRKSTNVGDLDRANSMLADNAQAQGQYERGANGWVHLNSETSFFCNYQRNFLTRNLIIDMHTVVSGACSQAGYGYDRRTNGGGANDLAVGRTFRGDGFCT